MAAGNGHYHKEDFHRCNPAYQRRGFAALWRAKHWTGVQESHEQYSGIVSQTVDKGFRHRETHHLPLLPSYLCHLAVGRGTDIYTVSKLLTHSNLATTQVYADVVDELKRDAAERISLKIPTKEESDQT